MTRVLLVDDEPLVLIGMQSMIDWTAKGFELAGTARNGGEALEKIEELHPDIVVSDIRMPVMDGLTLTARCREKDAALPAFIMLTSYEEFDYVRRSIGMGAVDYLVKLDLTPENLCAALERARSAVEKEKALRAPAAPATAGLESYRDRFFIQLYSGSFATDDQIISAAKELGLALDAPWYAVAVADIRNRELDPEQQATLSAGVTRMAADVLPKYLPAFVAAMDLRHFSVLLPLQDPEKLEEEFSDVLQKTNNILYKYFSTSLWWAIGRPVQSLHEVCTSKRTALSALPLLSDQDPIHFCRAEARTNLDHRARVVADVQEYIRQHLNSKLSLNDVAAVFNFSPGYLSQLFTQNGETSFVEFVTETRISAAKDLMASTDLMIYEISERLGFESAFYFSKVFKKLEGVSPRAYLQKLRGTPPDKGDPADVD